MRAWFTGLIAGLLLLMACLPLTAPALTTAPLSVIATVDQDIFIYDADSIPAVSNRVSAGLEATVQSAPFFVSVARLVAAKSLVRSSLPPLKGTFAKAFSEPARIRTFRAGEKVYRSPSLVEGALEPAEAPGAWLSTRRTVTKAGTESQINAQKKFGNPLEELRTYEFTKDVTVYYGRVADGNGYQIMIPRDVDPAEVLRYVEKAPLR